MKNRSFSWINCSINQTLYFLILIGSNNLQNHFFVFNGKLFGELREMREIVRMRLRISQQLPRTISHQQTRLRVSKNFLISYVEPVVC
jgi:hypothetical protein